ncbi:hypothetical protein CEUSTIGMA_g80.t1 [Chlamydomonas eustigma]|uniref:Uncharacterized protein n=1 Tax=Chlamydomonas eustigma TaxID=1157962 RepID=A0A250WP58_9CHLO|nr:hypothetical protein CEUSTIGMA_g80.t1 [Chlamydomonas eustigma]|eukprot:GAX72624.1 hypothetical protein CEUSTIGMA_g80.t1 [Chlamydomonas eustigma]
MHKTACKYLSLKTQVRIVSTDGHSAAMFLNDWARMYKEVATMDANDCAIESARDKLGEETLLKGSASLLEGGKDPEAWHEPKSIRCNAISTTSVSLTASVGGVLSSSVSKETNGIIKCLKPMNHADGSKLLTNEGFSKAPMPLGINMSSSRTAFTANWVPPVMDRSLLLMGISQLRGLEVERMPAASLRYLALQLLPPPGWLPSLKSVAKNNSVTAS